MSSTTNSLPADDATNATLPAGRIWRAGLIGIAIAVVGNVAFYWLMELISGPLLMPMPDGTLGPLPMPAIILFTAIPGIVATALFWLFTRYIARPVPKFVGVSIVFLILSFLPTLTLPAPTATKIVLSIMHVIAAAGIVGGLVQFTRSR